MESSKYKRNRNTNDCFYSLPIKAFNAYMMFEINLRGEGVGWIICTCQNVTNIQPEQEGHSYNISELYVLRHFALCLVYFEL